MGRLDVLITVDTEAWPRSPGWTRADLDRCFERDFHGRTAAGHFGLSYQMDILGAHGLKGVFLVESLFADAAGIEPLRRVVGLIQGRGHEVQLHAHTEWLDWAPEPILAGRRGRNIRDFTEDEQHLILGRALDNLRRAGATGVCAFRAGNYGADLATLRALKRLGLRFDTSYNQCYLESSCGLRLPTPLIRPRQVEGVWEVPIASFVDYPGHHRPAQFSASSYRELRTALLGAWRRGLPTFAIVSHSNEFLRRYRPGIPDAPDRIIRGRFERLCRFLAENPEKFRTAGFNDLALPGGPAGGPEPALRSRLLWTALRYGEQLLSRIGA